MSDNATFRIELEDVTRENPLLDEAMGKAAPKGAGPLPGPKGGPTFPATVLGPDGKAYSFDAFTAAQRKIEGQKKAAEANAAYNAFFAPPPLPKLPPPLPPLPTEPPPWKGRPSGEPQGGGNLLAKLAGQLGLGRYATAFGATQAGGAAGAEALGGAAAFAGPAAAALAAVELQTKSMQALKTATDGVAEGMEGLAQNNLTGFRDGLAETTKAFVGAIPLVGGALSAQLDAARAMVMLPERIKDAFVQRGHELAPYGAQIAGAEARGEARDVMANVREADVLGPDLERLINAETDLKMEVRELLLPIKAAVVDRLANGMETMVESVGKVERLIAVVEAVADHIAAALSFALERNFEKARETLDKLPGKIRRELDKKPEDQPADLWQPFFRALNRAKR